VREAWLDAIAVFLFTADFPFIVRINSERFWLRHQ